MVNDNRKNRDRSARRNIDARGRNPLQKAHPGLATNLHNRMKPVPETNLNPTGVALDVQLGRVEIARCQHGVDEFRFCGECDCIVRRVQ